MLLPIIIQLAILFLFIYFFVYIYKLEKVDCGCSEDWRRNFLKYYFAVIIGLVVISMFITPFVGKIIPENYYFIIKIIITIINITYIFITFQYIRKLKEEKCKCSEGQARTALEFFNYMQIILVVILLIGMIDVMFALTKLKNLSEVKHNSKVKQISKVSSKK
jgi:hypothetical protein